MSHFLRQFHLVSSLKSSPEKDVYPICKAMLPVLPFHPSVRKLQTQSVGKHLKLKTEDLKTNEKNQNKKKKPLAVILAWMLAKDSHIDKYSSLYLSRGFDVLTVEIFPKDMLFPVTGSQVIASSILDYFLSNQQYENIVLHSFSVGGYLMGEMFLKMRENVEKYQNISKRINGVVLDSAVDVEGIPTGLPRAMSKNPITIKVLEWYVSTHLAVMYNVATKHYLQSSKNFHNTPLRCPVLMFVSEADKVGTPVANRLVAENWQVRGIDVRIKCFKESKHVSHMYKYQDEYIHEIDEFLSKISMAPNKILK